MKVIAPIQIPNTWDRRRGKFLFERIKRFPSPSEGVVTAFRDGQVTLRSNRREDGFTNAELEIGYQGIRVGDLVIHGMDGFAGAIGVSDSNGKASPVVHAYRSLAGNDPRYYAYLLRDLALNGFIASLAKGIRERSTAFDSEMFKCLVLPLPPLVQQKAIADYLDRETVRIDALIEKKLGFVELLVNRQAEFERSAVVGLLSNSPVAQKMTGNPLIPCIPGDWKLVRARFLCSIDTGSSDTDESVEVGEYPFFVRSQTTNLSNRFVFDTEAVLTAGDGAGVGKVFHHFEGKFDAHQRVYVMHNFKGITGRFFFYFFSSYFGIAALDGSAKSTVDSVRRHMISELPVVVPPIDEQVRLVGILDESRTKMESTIVLLRKQVIRLRERREALITAAVTGEIQISEVTV